MVSRVPTAAYTPPESAGVTSAFGITPGTGLAGGGNLTASVTLSISATGVAAAAYGDATSVARVTFNAQGQATTATSVPITFPAPTTPTTAVVGLAASNQFSIGGSPVTGTGTITISMQTSSVAAGTYGNDTAVAQIAVNAQGQVTSASSVPISFPAPGGSSTAIFGIAVSNQFTVAGSPVTNTGTITLGMQTSTVVAGTYGNATSVGQFAVNAQGQVTSASGVSITFPTAAIIVQDEGTIRGTSSVINFAGAGVTATATGATALVTIGAGGADAWTYTALAANFATSSVVAQPSGLEFVPASNTRYEFEASLMTRTSDATSGPRPGFQWSSGLTNGVISIQQCSAAGTAVLAQGNITASVLAPVGGLPDVAGAWPALMWGVMVTGTAAVGTCRVQLASEVATSRTATILAASYLKFRAF